MDIIVILIILYILTMINLFVNEYVKNKELGCLTGNYKHIKKPTGFHVDVEYVDNGFYQWRPATNQEIRILKKYKYLI